MSNLTNKVLQEISDLTKNMDVLVKELKSAREEQGKSVDSLNKLTQNLTKSDEQKTKRDEESLSSQEVLFKNLTDSIQKSLEGRDNKLISGLNKSLSLDIEKAFSDFPNKVAQVKSNDTSTKNSFSDIIEQIATKTAEKTPGLKTGGEVTKKGMAVVGEEGPELVDLEKGDKVLSPRQAELMAKRQEVITKTRLDFEKSQAEREARIAKETQEQNLNELQGYPGKDDVINDLGVKVPRKAIEEERENLKKKDPNISQEKIEEEINGFVFAYKEPMKLEDIQKLNTPVVPKESEISGDKTFDESKKSKRDKGETQAKKEKTGTVEKQEKKDGLFSKLKEGGKNIVTDAKKSFESQKENLLESVNTLKKETTKTSESTPERKEAPKSQIKVESIRGDLQKLADPNFKFEDTSKKESSPPSISTAPGIKGDTQQMSTNIDTSNTTKENTQTKKMASTSNNISSSPADLNTDLNQIKGLLSAIYKALSGPLSISSDIPFRPNSNHL
jgi:hypothetical protein